MDLDDLVLECTTCSGTFVAGENLVDDGQHVLCPHCGALDVDEDLDAGESERDWNDQ